jgi:hypothetical protein
LSVLWCFSLLDDRWACPANDVGDLSHPSLEGQQLRLFDRASPYVWKSTNYGQTWTSLVGNIPLGPVNVIREDPTNPKILYVGTDMGVYVSLDGGASWEVLGGNLPSVYVHDLIVHPREKVVVIATHGRGMWAIDATPVEGSKK